MVSPIVFLIGVVSVIGCHRPSLREAKAQDILPIYEAVLRAITAEFPLEGRPPIEREVMEWYYMDPRERPDSEARPTLRQLPDTFVARLARERVLGGLCPADGCRRVASAITLSPPHAGANGGLVVQASLQGSGCYQYAVRRAATGWIVVRREELMVY
jgi:hypothetical protein